MSRKEGTPDRSGEEPEHNEVVHFQEIAARNANHVLDIGASLGVRGVALGFHVTWFETAMTCGGEVQLYEISRLCQSGKGRAGLLLSLFSISIKSSEKRHYIPSSEVG